MTRTNEDHHGYGGDAACYDAPRAWCPVCGDLPWPVLPWLHRSAHRAERYSALAAEDAVQAEIMREVRRDEGRAGARGRSGVTKGRVC